MQHPILASLALTLLPLQTLAAQGFRYAPGDASYEATVITKMSREVGGERMEDEVTQRQRFSVSLKAIARDTLRIGLTLDSASLASRVAGPQDVSPLLGIAVEGHLSPVGKVYSSRLAHGNLGPAGEMVAAELARFLPTLRSDLRPGLSWTDTTTEELEMMGVPIRRRTITTSRVAGDTTIAGERAWRIDRTTSVSFTGEGAVQGAPLVVDGATRSSGKFFVARAGRFLGSTQSDSSTTRVSSGTMSFSVSQSQTANVSRR